MRLGGMVGWFLAMAVGSLQAAPTWYYWDYLPPAEKFSDLAVYLSQDASYAVDLATGEITDLPMPNHPVNNPGTCFAGEVLIKVGGVYFDGWSNTVVQYVEAFDPNTGLWSDLPPLILARSASACVFVNGTIYVFGGDEDSIFTGYCFAFDGSSWSLFKGIKTYKRGFGPYAKQYYYAQVGRTAVVLEDGRIAVAGGSGESTGRAKVDLLDPRGRTWSVGTALPKAIAYGIVIHGDAIYDPATGDIVSPIPGPQPPTAEMAPPMDPTSVDPPVDPVQ